MMTAEGQSVESITLAEAYDRIISGVPPDVALLDFLDAFDRASSVEVLAHALSEAPRLTGNDRLDALAAAIADYVAKQHRLGSIPSWVCKPERFLARPWHTCPFEDHGLREYLTFASPGEFKTRDIFTDDRPLRRGSHLLFALKTMGRNSQ